MSTPPKAPNSTEESWIKFLDPTSLKENLIKASLFLAAYETLRNSVIEQIRSFFSSGFDEHGPTISSRYQSEVLSRHKSPLRASLLWLLDMGVISNLDIDMVDHIRKHRNALAHDLPSFISTIDAQIDSELINSICALVTKIDRWWVREFEIPVNREFDNKIIEDFEITSGNMLFLQLMIHIATSSHTEAQEFYMDFKNKQSSAREQENPDNSD